MSKLALVSVLLLAGCGGSSFSSATDLLATDGGPIEHDSGPVNAADSGTSTGGSTSSGGASSGGAETVSHDDGSVSSGGSIVSGSGGIVSGTGGIVSSGGATGSGGAPSSGGASNSGGSGGCALVTHDNGLGQTWQDCVSLGTRSYDEATKACRAYCAVQPCVHTCVQDTTSHSFCGEPLAGVIGGEGQTWYIDGTVKELTGAACDQLGTWN